MALAAVRGGGKTIYFDGIRNAYVCSKLPEYDERKAFADRVLAGNFAGPPKKPHFSDILRIALIQMLIATLNLFRIPISRQQKHAIAWALAQVSVYLPYHRRIYLAHQLSILSDPQMVTNFEHWLTELGAVKGPKWNQLDAASDVANIEFGAGDRVILAGAGWCYLDFQYLENLKASHNVEFIGIIYDLLPIESPSVVTARQRIQYRHYLLSMAKLCNLIVAPSARIAKRLMHFLEAHGASSGVRISTVRMSSGLSVVAPASPSRRIANLGLSGRPFVLAVSGIRPRKGQIWLSGLWGKIHVRFAERTPILIFAGTPIDGNIFSPCVSEEDIDAARGNLLCGPSDEELAWLYENAKFTLYPSREGGSGMPIAESWKYGKYCVCDEAVLQGSTDAPVFLAPRDERRWIAEITRLIDDPCYLEERNASVIRKTVATAWPDIILEGDSAACQ